jgi:hypothetical protein
MTSSGLEPMTFRTTYWGFQRNVLPPSLGSNIMKIEKYSDCCLVLACCLALSSTLKMEVVYCSETLVIQEESPRQLILILQLSPYVYVVKLSNVYNFLSSSSLLKLWTFVLEGLFRN